MPRTHRKKSLVLLAIALLIIELILSLFINLIRGRTQSTLTYFLVSPHTNYAALVDPFTGTSVQNGAPFGGGGTFPGADVPSGMVQWSPDTVNPRPGGYAYNDHRRSPVHLQLMLLVILQRSLAPMKQPTPVIIKSSWIME